LFAACLPKYLEFGSVLYAGGNQAEMTAEYNKGII